jgi:hypothetical protein
MDDDEAEESSDEVPQEDNEENATGRANETAEGTPRWTFPFAPFGGFLKSQDTEHIVQVKGNEPENGSPEGETSSPSESQISEELIFDTETNNRGSIFRRPESDGPRLQNGFGSQRLVTTAVSEGGIWDGRQIKKNYFKANFPFLSATKLLPSYHAQLEVESTDGRSSSEDQVIRRSHTWTAPVFAFQDEDVRKGQTSCINEVGMSSDDTPGQSEPSSPNDLEPQTDAQQKDGQQHSSLEWTEHGPPAHWATGRSLEEIFPKIKEPEEDTPESSEDAPLHFTSHPFASVSQALQENIIAHFRPVVERILSKEERSPSSDVEEAEPQSLNSPTSQDQGSTDGESQQEQSISKSVDSETTSASQMKGLLEEANPKTGSTIARKRLGLVTVAGGIAGGVAGLVFAGPVGGVIGAKVGQTAGILGVILEGSLTIGVVGSGIAAGRYTGQQLQEKLEENRILALGSGDGTHRGFLLVRPSITTDPVWAEFNGEARQLHPKGLSFNLLPSGTQAAKRERYEREVDIVKTDENEIPTADKVLLLVSRILNNKESLPGHVYRQLIEKLRQRAEDRGPLAVIDDAEEADKDDAPGNDSTINPSDLLRARRQDAHAVIKYVTVTLLEVRPGFAVSPSITELTATAVEGLVFGEVYDLIIEEIEAECESRDNDLLEKIAEFERLQGATEDKARRYKSCVSEPALEALHHLPEAHSAVDKLRYGVIFLEKISEFFSAACRDGAKGSSSMGADSLLKMVCQHILVAKVFAINAQVAFLEEFARDEQLLRGKEGYALVTLQASLHFLNASNDFENDIFGQEDD